nr:MAG TPA: hypothetical protein [Caudoviricetes sp.]
MRDSLSLSLLLLCSSCGGAEYLLGPLSCCLGGGIQRAEGDRKGVFYVFE